jgi:hypothetical protein
MGPEMRHHARPRIVDGLVPDSPLAVPKIL